jgi:hypothetical protein
MNQIIIIKDGAEYPCIKDNNGRCSTCCPNLITFEGYLIKEAVQLSRPTFNRVCAIKEANYKEVKQ